MENLKMKFKLHGLEFEIEGNETTVKAEFANFKAFITEDLLTKINIIAPQVTTISQPTPIRQIGQIQEATTIDITDFPVLMEIVKKDLPKTESEWILIYGFYASNFGDNPFSIKHIKEKYEECGRKDIKYFKNIDNNVKTLLKKGYFKMHTSSEYIIKEQGIEYTKQILQGNSTTKTVNRVIKKSKLENKEKSNAVLDKKSKTSKSSSTKFVDLALPSNEINSLTEFFNSKKPQTQNEKIAVIMKWYKDHIKSNEISLEEINYLMKVCSKVPSALGQVLINMKGDGFRWVSNTNNNGNVQLTSIGETYVLNKLPKTTK
jgi:hypothetical protein